ncbi:asparagine synthase (glutamine-hydrolysing) [Cyclobacterium xiamenense]|uniref:asparagine synthase (glutamine-hydrolyzing) n=1 Tax=Cyclobacterium xiamenense TaxID=1297121 RepID=A0A1H6WMR8_9BACT|nr:asparagine synthase (glutamine-hydrolyzing) [Cyclobacterium xiamenense]SEJ18321.1 asparagine synthase (glutamine-hydrolysing) [Cyclobacterium xiamenense]
MCGVHLLLTFPQRNKEAIQAMTQTCRHRGPDHTAWSQVAPGVYLGANRLKILDLHDRANQPLVYRAAQAHLAWNGFLYNYQDLRNELLQEGVHFETASDGEVLLHWLIRKGAAGVGRLQGMYAFAFVDGKNERVLVARDPLGVKSLYYAQEKGVLLCSSELRCLRRSGLVPGHLNEAQIVPYMYLRHALPSHSFLRGVQELLPGELRTWDLQGKPLGSTQIPFKAAGPKPAETGENAEELLTDAVLKQVHADVPAGLILSGGADSSLIYHLWNKHGGGAVPTFTVGFQRPYRRAFADADFAARLVAGKRAFHQEITISPDWFLETWPDYIRELDVPVGDAASYLTWAVAKKARNTVKILLSGAGADELFAGYNRHAAYKRYLANPVFWNRAASVGKRFPVGGRRLRQFLGGIHPDPIRTFMNFAGLYPLPDSLATELSGLYPKEDGPFTNALAWDKKVYLVHDLLKIHDNACMAHGIEGRVPFLDWQVVDWSLRRSEADRRNAAPKHWIKSLLRQEGLAAHARRTKFGFGLPLKEWLQGHAGFRNRVVPSVIHFGRRFEEVLPSEWKPLTRHPEKHLGNHYLLLYNLFLLNDWIEENQL